MTTGTGNSASYWVTTALQVVAKNQFGRDRAQQLEPDECADAYLCPEFQQFVMNGAQPAVANSVWFRQCWRSACIKT